MRQKQKDGGPTTQTPADFYRNPHPEEGGGYNASPQNSKREPHGYIAFVQGRKNDKFGLNSATRDIKLGQFVAAILAFNGHKMPDQEFHYSSIHLNEKDLGVGKSQAIAWTYFIGIAVDIP